MAEYRRFIAYIYEYINGVKGNNAGFVKVESRNGICRFQVHLQGVSKGETSIGIFGFAKNKSAVEVLPLGNASVTEDVLEFKGSTPHNNFGNSQFTLEQIAGMYLHGGQGSIYATAWDNDNVDVESLKRLTKNIIPTAEKEEETAKTAEHQSGQQIMSEPSALESRSENKGEGRAEDGNGYHASMGTAAEEVSRTVGEIFEEKEVQENSPQPQTEMASEKVGESSQAQTDNSNWSEEVHAAETDMFSQYEPGYQPQHESAPAHRNNNGQSNNPQGQVHMTQAQAYAYAQTQAAGRQQVYGRGTIGNTNTCLERKWEHFQCQYPKFMPFTDNEITECVQIAPKDIMYLRREEWRFSRNNFLTQGYYNHRHLLLGKVSDGGFVLGVPGYDENQERFMANMFGFVSFKPASMEGKSGKFGYWLRPVR